MDVQINQEAWIRLLAALCMGGAIGFEREYNAKAAGFRTMILICVGAALFTMLSARIEGDVGRIAANIVNGIGFLGAGIIYREESRTKGLTTAASVWVVSALGMSLGYGHYEIAVVGFGLVLFTLLVLVKLTDGIQRMNQSREYKIVTIFQNKTLQQYEHFFRSCGLKPNRGQQQRIGTDMIGYWRVDGSEKNHEKCIKRLLHDPNVKEFTF